MKNVSIERSCADRKKKWNPVMNNVYYWETKGLWSFINRHRKKKKKKKIILSIISLWLYGILFVNPCISYKEVISEVLMSFFFSNKSLDYYNSFLHNFILILLGTQYNNDIFFKKMWCFLRFLNLFDTKYNHTWLHSTCTTRSKSSKCKMKHINLNHATQFTLELIFLILNKNMNLLSYLFHDL